MFVGGNLPDIRSIYALIRYVLDNGSINWKSANRVLERNVDDYHIAIDLAFLVCLGVVLPTANWYKPHYLKEDANEIERKISVLLHCGHGYSWKSPVGELLLDIFTLNIILSDMGWVDVTAMNKLFHDATKQDSNPIPEEMSQHLSIPDSDKITDNFDGIEDHVENADKGMGINSVLFVGELMLDTVNRSLLRGKRKIVLTNIEYSLLLFMMRKPNEVLFCEMVDVQDFNLDFNQLQKKIDNGFSIKMIHKIRGEGYLLQKIESLIHDKELDDAGAFCLNTTIKEDIQTDETVTESIILNNSPPSQSDVISATSSWPSVKNINVNIVKTSEQNVYPSAVNTMVVGTKDVSVKNGASSMNQTDRCSDKPIHLGHEPTNKESIHWNISIKTNPHLMIVGLPGMGKTTSLITICRQMVCQGIAPIIFSYHDDIDEKLIALFGNEIQFVDYAGLGFNPLQVVTDSEMAYIDNVSMLRDIFASIFPDLGDIQLGRLREALKLSYQDKGWGDATRDRSRLNLPEFKAFYEYLNATTKNDKADKGLLTRLDELNDYGFFKTSGGTNSLFDINKPAIIRIHKTQNEVLQKAFATFVLHNLYQQMFIRGVQGGISHAIIFDEAHRAAKLKLIPTMVKECRKYGIAFVLASQEAKDFDPSLFNAVANYLALRLNESDARVMAKIMASNDQAKQVTDKIKQMHKYHGLFFGEGRNKVVFTQLASE